MKKRLLFLIILFTTISCFAQKFENSGYSTRLSDTSFCCLKFYKEGRYALFLEERQLDVISVTAFSYGRFTVKQNEITLFDTAHGFQMKLLILKNGELKVIKGLSFLSSQRFRLLYSNSFEDNELKMNLNPIKQRKEREQYQQKFSTKNALYYGSYVRGGFVLEIQKANKYAWHYKGFTISTGSWTKNGNELVLLDTCLNHAFYALIGKDIVISKYLPGDYQGLSLYHSSLKNLHVFGDTISTYTYQKYVFPVKEKREITEPYSAVEVMPQFPNGGDTGLRQYLKENTKYTDAMKKGATKDNVVVRFVIEKDGSIANVEILRSMNEACDTEAIRVVKSMPKWIPGKQNGVPVAVYYTIAVNFD